jgi:hypothetical protein
LNTPKLSFLTKITKSDDLRQKHLLQFNRV